MVAEVFSMGTALQNELRLEELEIKGMKRMIFCKKKGGQKPKGEGVCMKVYFGSRVSAYTILKINGFVQKSYFV